MQVGYEKLQFSTNMPKVIQDLDSAIVTVLCQWKCACDLPNGAIFNDDEWPLTHISMACHCLTMNISKMMHSTYNSYTGHFKKVAPPPKTFRNILTSVKSFCAKLQICWQFISTHIYQFL